MPTSNNERNFMAKSYYNKRYKPVNPLSNKGNYFN